GDAARHLVAQLQKPFAPAAIPTRFIWFCEAAGAAKAVNDPAKARERELAPNNAPAPKKPTRHREQHPLRLPPLTRAQFVPRRRDVKAHAARLLAARQPG